MTILAIFDESGTPVADKVTDQTKIASLLAENDVLFEQWQANQPLSENAEQEEVIAAYQSSIDMLNNKFGFKTVDVVAIKPDNPQKAEFRQKFLAEHTHDDFEIRFFVDGCGLFYLHMNEKVYLLLCEKGDLISVPANTTHWFDMGENPAFKCIRFFTTNEGWVGNFTGSDIARLFPTMDEFVENNS